MTSPSGWLRSNWPVATAWLLLLAAVALAGLLASRMRCSYLEGIAANLVPDLLVAGLLFFLADVALGLTENRRQRIEAQLKAYSIVGMEVEHNVEELRATLGNLQGGLMPPLERPDIEDRQWNLLIQSPLVDRLPANLVWTIHKSYYDAQRQAENLKSHRRSQFRDPYPDPDTAGQLLPQIEAALASAKLANRMLKDAANEN